MRSVLTRTVSLIALACFGLTLSPNTVCGQCVDYSGHLHWVGSVAAVSSGGLEDVAMTPDLAYIASTCWGGSGYSGCYVVVDLAVPHLPQVVASGQVPINGDSGGQQVTMAGQYAYVAGWEFYAVGTGRGRFLVQDLTDPTSPQLVASLSFFNFLHDVAVENDYAYVTSLEGLVVLDVSDPTLPDSVASLPGVGSQVAACGNHLYTTAWDSFQVIDVADPTNPQIVGNLDGVGGFVAAPALEGWVAVARHASLWIIDVTDAASPSVLATAVILPDASGIDIAGDHVYVRSNWSFDVNGFQVFDLSDPASPVVVRNSYCMPKDSHDTGIIRGLASTANLACVIDRYRLQVFEASDPVPAPTVGSVETLPILRDVALVGNHAFASAGPGYGYSNTGIGSLHVIDVANPTAPTEVGSVDIPRALSVAASGDYAHVGTGYGYSGVREVYVADPTSPQVVGSVDTPAPAIDVAVQDTYVYAAARFVYAIDFSDPTAPHIVGSLDTPGNARRIALVAPYLYVADGPGGLQIMNVSDPANLLIAGSVSLPDKAWGVTVAWPHVTTGPPGICDYGPAALHIIDISDPASPWVVGSADTWETACGVAVVEQYAYLAGGGMDFEGTGEPAFRTGALAVVDVSNPANPNFLSNTGMTIGSVVAAGDLVFAPGLAGLLEGSLHIYPLQCQQPVPVTLSGFTAELRNRDILLSWLTSFERMHDGFNVYRSGQLQSGYARLNDRMVRGRSPYTFLDQGVRPSTTYYYKLGAVDLRGREVMHDPISVTTPPWGTRTELRLASPSPFRSETALNFTLATPGEARLAVYDVAGRLVRVLVNEELPVGDHGTTWNGRDDAGLRVAGGAYFAKLTAGDITQTRKVVFLGGK